MRFTPESGEIWLDNQRMIMVHTAAMSSLRRELIETMGRERARGVLTRMGYASGTRDASFIRSMYPDESEMDFQILNAAVRSGQVRRRAQRISG